MLSLLIVFGLSPAWAGDVIAFPGTRPGPSVPSPAVLEFIGEFGAKARACGGYLRAPRVSFASGGVRRAYRDLLFALDLEQAARLREFMALVFPELGEPEPEPESHEGDALNLIDRLSAREVRRRRAYHVVEAVLPASQTPAWAALLNEIYGED